MARVVTLDLPAIADWNAAIARARRAYHESPFALADLLERTGEDACSRCRENKHAHCTGRMGHSGAHPCLCEHASHDPTGATA